MECQNIENQIALGKSAQFDFFSDLEDLKAVFNTISAFANTDGGILVIGVKSNKKIVGVYPSEVIERIKNESVKYLSPSFDFDLRSIGLGHHLVVCIHVLEHANKIGIVTGDGDEFFIREGSQSVHASKLQKIIWKEEGKWNVDMDDLVEELKLIKELINSAGQISLSKLYKKTTMRNALVDKLVAWQVSEGVFKLTYKNDGWLIQG